MFENLGSDLEDNGPAATAEKNSNQSDTVPAGSSSQVENENEGEGGNITTTADNGGGGLGVRSERRSHVQAQMRSQGKVSSFFRPTNTFPNLIP